MDVVIVGMGEVGRHVARVLQAERHNVIVVDNDPDALQAVEEHQDVAVLHGYGASPGILRQARADKADLVVAVTNHDEANLVTAITAKDMGARRTIARLQGGDYDEANRGVQYDVLGIDVVVNPRILVAQEISRIARSHGALEVMGLCGNRVEIVEVELPASSKVTHKPLQDLRATLPSQTLIAGVNRVADRRFFVPDGAEVLFPGDRVYVIGRAEKMEAVEDKLAAGSEANRVCVIGGGVVGLALAQSLAPSDVEVKIIERDRARADFLAAELPPSVEVIHGDGTNLSLLEEEHVGDFDLVCSVSHEDEVNLMSGLLAKRVGAERTVSLVHRPDYMDIYRQLGIDIVLSPRLVASEHILRYVRQTELRSLHLLEGGAGEVLELVATEGSRIIGTPLKRLNFPRGAIIGAVVSGTDVRVPTGDDVIQAGDTVVVVTTANVRSSVDRLFKKRVL